MVGWTQDATARPPFLTEPRLYVAGVLESVPDERIVEALSECLRLRPMIERQTGSATAEATGYVEFESLDRAEKAYAIANPAWLPEYNCSLRLHLSPPPSSDPSPSATARVFKALPLDTTPGALFDLCRPFGPVHRAALHYAPAHTAGSGPTEFKGQAYVNFYNEKDAQKATDDLHCTEFGGATICVEPYFKPKPRKSDSSTSRWADTPSFVGMGHPSLNAVAPSFSPTRNFSGTSQSSIYSQPSLSPGLPPHILQSSTAGAAINPCNLFIKSLDPSLTSQDLHAAFSPYGQILSARVMYNDQTGVSKEFGFVNFTTPAEAYAALNGMDGVKLVGSEGRGKHVVVRIHEPKNIREGRLRQRYSGARDDVESRLSSLSFGESPDRSPHGSVYDMGRQQSADMYPSSPENSMSPLPTQSSPSPTPLSEQERLLVAVRKMQPDQANAIVELLMGLPKKERAMCLFNPEHLKAKIADALIILTPDSDSEPTPVLPPATALPPPASTPEMTKAVAVPSTFAELARLPAADFVQLVTSTSLSSLGVERVDVTLEDDTNAFMDRLEGKPVADVKQKLGDRLFKVVKSLGVKGAPKITIQLLDSEDLRALAHLADYPAVLKERISPPASK